MLWEWRAIVGAELNHHSQPAYSQGETLGYARFHEFGWSNRAGHRSEFV